MTTIHQEQDSLSLRIQPPQPPQQQINISKLRDSQIKTTANHQKLSVYFTINKIYIQNLISRKQRPSINNQIISTLGKNCIIYKDFSVDPKQCRLFNGDQHQIKGHIYILYNHQHNVEFKIYFNKQVKKPDDFMWIQFSYSYAGVWKSKSFSLDQDQKIFSYKVPMDQFNEYLEPNVLVTITIRKRQSSNANQLGIINLGNTCFMNSVLQMLFYIRPLRKIILESESQNKLIKQLKQVFIMLMDVDQKQPVDVQNLLESYDKYNEHPRRQQDVQQFLLDFINQIQKQCPQVKPLWQGKCSQTTYSVQKGKHYKSIQQQIFAQLDVHLFNQKNKFYSRIQESIQDMMKEEQVQEMIDHEEYGKIKVAKYRTYIQLPQIIFINLKRYEWNKQKMRLSKILSPIDYKQSLNLGFIVGTPGNTDLNPDCDYTLFSVIVHKGSSPQHGHYFVFVNVSENYKHPKWLCFNDSIVTQSDSQQILGFTGKKNKQTTLDKSIGRFIDKDIQSDASSYLLVYIRTAIFNEYQSIRTPVPKNYINEKLKKKAQKQKQSLQDINVLMIQNFNSSIDLFSYDLEYISVPLPKDGSVKVELKKISKQIFGSQPKYFFRVYINDRKVKKVQNYEIVSDLVKLTRGYENPNYILILPQKVPQIRPIPKDSYFGLLNISKNQFQDLMIPKFGLTTPAHLQQLQRQIELQGGTLRCLDQLQDFKRHWNRYMEIQIIKN